MDQKQNLQDKCVAIDPIVTSLLGSQIKSLNLKRKVNKLNKKKTILYKMVQNIIIHYRALQISLQDLPILVIIDFQ